ncbi:hypothetical protein LXL04_007190 [Taraxacum kok-saghyz]
MDQSNDNRQEFGEESIYHLTHGPSSCNARTTCWFKFGKNGVDAKGVGIYASQSRIGFISPSFKSLRMIENEADKSIFSIIGTNFAKLQIRTNQNREMKEQRNREMKESPIGFKSEQIGTLFLDFFLIQLDFGQEEAKPV